MGHSWGTILGTQYVLENPEKISAYIAIGYSLGRMEKISSLQTRV